MFGEELETLKAVACLQEFGGVEGLIEDGSKLASQRTAIIDQKHPRTHPMCS